MRVPAHTVCAFKSFIDEANHRHCRSCKLDTIKPCACMYVCPGSSNNEVAQHAAKWSEVLILCSLKQSVSRPVSCESNWHSMVHRCWHCWLSLCLSEDCFSSRAQYSSKDNFTGKLAFDRSNYRLQQPPLRAPQPTLNSPTDYSKVRSYGIDGVELVAWQIKALHEEEEEEDIQANEHCSNASFVLPLFDQINH